MRNLRQGRGRISFGLKTTPLLLSFGLKTTPLLLVATACQATSIPRFLGSEAEYFKPSARIYFDTGKDDEDEIDLYEDGSINPAVDFLAINWPLLVRESTLAMTMRQTVQSERNKLDQLQRQEEMAATREAEMEVVLEAARREEARLAAAESPSDPASRVAQQARASAEVELLRAKEAKELATAREREQSAKTDAMKRDAERAKQARLDGDWIVGPRFLVGLTTPASDSGDGVTEASGAPVLYLGLSAYMDLFKGDRKPNSNDGVGVRLESGYLWGITADENIANADDSAVFVGMSVFL